MRRYPQLLPFIFAVILPLFPTFSHGQVWSGILAPSRAIDWSGAGLPATLPDGETTTNPWTPPTRTQCTTAACQTLCGTFPACSTAGTVNATTINAAINSAPSGSYVLLPPGNQAPGGVVRMDGYDATYHVGTRHSGVTLRGQGPMLTTLTFNAANGEYISFGTSWGGPFTATISSGYSKGSTSMVITGGSNLAIGQLAVISQCDSGYSGVNNCVGSPSDPANQANGSPLYVCGWSGGVCNYGTSTGGHAAQAQVVRVTGCDGQTTIGYHCTNYKSATITFSPGIYVGNYSSSQTPWLSWTGAATDGWGPEPSGNGIEDMTIVFNGSPAMNYGIDVSRSYASWIKGVRVLGKGSSYAVAVNNVKNSLIFNNYFYAAYNSGSDNDITSLGLSSDNLILNNIMTGGNVWAGGGGNTGNVIAYNWGNHANSAYYQNNIFEHLGGSFVDLFEGNQSKLDEDDTWGTHNLNTWFRNYAPGWETPFVMPGGGSAVGISFEPFARFENALGNVIGDAAAPSSVALLAYQSTPASPQSRPVWVLGTGGGLTDPLVATTLMRWGNCDTITAGCNWNSSEVPSSLANNMAPYSNPVPPNHNLPPSFFLPVSSAHLSGGTGLSWWKVCDTWTAFPSSCSHYTVQPFPIAGPDVTGGPSNYVGGHAYDIPASVAFNMLPVDPSYVTSYTVTSSSYNSGTVTLNGSFPTGEHLLGAFTLVGGTCGNARVLMTGSDYPNGTYVKYSAASNCNPTSIKFPNVRQFDEAVYQADSSAGSGSAPAAPSGLSNVVQ